MTHRTKRTYLLFSHDCSYAFCVLLLHHSLGLIKGGPYDFGSFSDPKKFSGHNNPQKGQEQNVQSYEILFLNLPNFTQS